VINVVWLFQTVVDQDHARDELDQIVFGDRAHGGQHGVVNVQPLVELVAPHPLQVVAALIEQLAFQIFARIVESRRVAGTHPLVELQQRGLGDGHVVAQVPLRLHANGAFDVVMIRVVVNLFIDCQ